MTTKVIVNGANGKMGTLTVATIDKAPAFELVGKLGRGDDLAAAIQDTQADIVIDLTRPDTLFEQAQTIIANKARPVIGTSGLNNEQIKTLQQACKKQSIGGIIAPNFSLSAILMMRYAQDAAQYFDDVEIIEMHHPLKVDAPSGTAAKTADLINSVHKNKNSHAHTDAARGDNHQGTTIHSVRLPGVFAQQSVMFGGSGETLTIEQRSIDRQCMMPGVLLCCKKVMGLKTLIYGMENLL